MSTFVIVFYFFVYSKGMKISDRRKELPPREKLQARGAEALSDYELLMAILASRSLTISLSQPNRTKV